MSQICFYLPNYDRSSNLLDQTITTTDLISWCFQIAQGMNYVSSRGVLHGDLAARNVLLCRDKTVKICDFGFSRSLKPDEDYKKKSDVSQSNNVFIE